MQSWKRLFYFILLNILVSAVTTWVVVSVLMRNFAPDQPLTLLLEPSSSQELDSGDPQNGETESISPENPPESDAPVITSDQLEINTIIGADDLENERVLIRHVGDVEVSLAGWKLEDEDGNLFTFPALTMFNGGAVTIYSKQGTNTVVEMYWGADKPVWQVGEQALLRDPAGNVQAVYIVP